MCYVIYDGVNYVGKDSWNKYYLTTDINRACKWTKVKADNVLQSLQYNIICKEKNFQVTYVTKCNNPAVPIELDFDIIEKVKEISSITERLEQRKLYLNSLLSECDLELVDIQHAAEFYNLNAAQGYKIYKMLHDVTTKRRAYKNEMKKIEAILYTPIKSEKIKNVENAIAGLENQKYSPRIYKELFEV